MPKKFDKDFLSRIQFIACGRDITPWLHEFGIPKATTSRIVNGQAPSTDFLTRLQRFEGARIDWLLTGKGTPYLITYCNAVDECRLVVEAIRAESGWRLFHVTDGQRHALAMRRPASWGDDDAPPIDYMASELLTVDGGLPQPPAITTDGRYEIPPGDMDRLLNGEIGTWLLWQAPDALLGGEPLRDRRISDMPGAYSAQAELHQLIDQLTPAQQAAVHTLVRSLKCQ